MIFRARDETVVERQPHRGATGRDEAAEAALPTHLVKHVPTSAA
jgi:hypothetical protein